MKQLIPMFALATSALFFSVPAHAGILDKLIDAGCNAFGNHCGNERDREWQEGNRKAEEARKIAEEQRRKDQISALEKSQAHLRANISDLEEIDRLIAPTRSLVPNLVEDAQKGLASQRESRSLLARAKALWESYGDMANQVSETFENARVVKLGSSQDAARIRKESELAADALKELQTTAKLYRIGIGDLLKRAGATLEEAKAKRLVENLSIVVTNLRAAEAYTRSRLQSLRSDLATNQADLAKLRG